MKDAIVMPHGVARLFVSDERRQRSEISGLNTAHAVQQDLNGTAVRTGDKK